MANRSLRPRTTRPAANCRATIGRERSRASACMCRERDVLSSAPSEMAQTRIGASVMRRFPARFYTALVLLGLPVATISTLAQSRGSSGTATPGASQPASTQDHSRRRSFAAPPKLSDRDILRLKLHEFPLEGEPDKLTVRFTMGDERKSVEDLVLAQLADDPIADPTWSKLLRSGTPPERLQVVLAATGMKYLDRIVLQGDPRVFDDYRRNVVPLLTRGCLRSGCHGGSTAQVFRFPVASPSSDAYLYTSFYILDQIDTADGPLINRAVPESSVLLAYMLPPTADGPKHPPVEHDKLNPAIPKQDSAEHKAILDWLSSLRIDRQYQLEYSPPDWLKPRPRSAAVSQPTSNP